MTDKLMYFGTKERMTWIPCPSINAGLGMTSWGTVSEYLNGGATSRFSSTGHREYSFSWSPTTQESLYSVLDYFYGAYGDAPYYFIDPFAAGTNVLPMWLAAPRLAADDAPSLVMDKRPYKSPTASNSLGHPTQSAVYSLVTGDVARTFDFPVPPGYTFHFGVKGSASGTAAVTLNGSPVTPTYVTDGTRFTASSTQPWVTVSVQGAGTLALASMAAVVLPTGTPPPSGAFVSGRGNSGVARRSNPVVTGYSAVLNASVGATVELVETGGWL